MAERLARAGRRGAEVLSDAMDRCFTGLIDAFAPYGGDVYFFGGDALFVLFVGSDHARRAIDGSVAMHGELRRMGTIRTALGGVDIRVSVGIGSGSADLIVGDGPQRPMFLVGPTISRALRMESRASAGQVLADEPTANEDGGTSVRALDRSAWRVTRRRPRPPPETSTDRPMLPTSGQPALHLPEALRHRLLVGDAPSEHRLITVAFVVLRGLDELARDERVRIVQEASVEIGEACQAFDVAWVHPDVIANGAKVILAAGVPIQRDDDELRMVAAARRIATARIAPHLAIGVHRGTAFVGEFGHPARRTYSVNGDTTITAARLTAAAGPGQVLATAEVIEKVGGRYEVGDVLSVEAKGKRLPLRAHLVGEVRSGRSGPALADFVGRRAELAALRARVAKLDTGRGAIVEVAGPPGIGKTRLVQEAIGPDRSIDVSGELAFASTPFWALRSPLRAALGIDSDSASLRRVERCPPLLASVLGIDLAAPSPPLHDPASAALHRSELLTRLLRQSASSAILVIDDTHLLDAASSELLGVLARSLADDGWLVVVTRRSNTEGVPIVADEVVALSPLSHREAAGLAVAVTSAAPLSDALLEAVVQRVEGNPLFTIELARMAASTRAVGLPESAERAAGTRIDRLEFDQRRRLRQAAVLGRRVDLRLLRRITGDRLVLERDAWLPLDEFVRHDHGCVTFRSDLYRLTAYEGLTFGERSELHREVVHVLSRRRSVPPSVLAEHASSADRPFLVVHWATKAAEDAERGGAFADAARFRELAATGGRSAALPHVRRAELHFAAGDTYKVLADLEPAERHYRCALRLAPPQFRTRARTSLAELALQDDQLDVAIRRVGAALRHLAPSEATAKTARVELLILRAAIRGVRGDRRKSDGDAHAAALAARKLRRRDLRGQAIMQLALNADLADEANVEALLSPALRLLEESGRHRDAAVLQLDRANTHMTHGRWPAALARFELADRGFARCGDVLGAIAVDVNRAGILMEQGHLGEALELFATVERRARAMRNERKALFARGSAHRTRAWMGQSDAITPLAESAEALDALGHRSEADDLAWYLVEALVMHGRFTEALERAPALLDRLSARPGEAAILTVRRATAVARHCAREPAALDELRQVLEDARSESCGIEIARCAQALEGLSPVIDPAWTIERQHWCAELGVVWLPPVTFSLDRRSVSPQAATSATCGDTEGIAVPSFQ